MWEWVILAPWYISNLRTLFKSMFSEKRWMTIYSRESSYEEPEYTIINTPSWWPKSWVTTCRFLAFPRDLTCIVCPTQNNWYKILKIVPEILQIVHDPMKLVPLNLDTLGISYDCFTWNTLLRLVNKTSQIPYLTQGVSINLRWPRSWNFYHKYLTNFCKIFSRFQGLKH